MQTRRIGSLEVSVLSMGCNNFGIRFGEERSAEIVRAALEVGINYFDTSDSYGEGRSEECLGAALAGRREEAVIATKYDGAPDTARSSCIASLRRLSVEVIDLFQLHHPYPGAPISETLGALGELVAEGLVREVGCSNFDVAMLEESERAAALSGARFTAIQNDYNLLNRKAELEVIPFCGEHAIGFNAYFPLYHGLLTGKFERNAPLVPGSRLAEASEARKAAVFSEENLDALDRLNAFCAERDRSLLELALSFPLSRPGVVAVVAGASDAAQTRANAAAVSWELSDAELAELDRLVPVDPEGPDTPSKAHGVA